MLRSLSELPDAPPPRWWHWVVGVDDRGRLTLPADARGLAAGGGVVRASSRGDAVVFRRDGLGAETPVDRRGRLRLPPWLGSHLRSSGGVVFVAARRPDATTVVVTPVAGLDGLADALVGEVG
jgi:hypothetical protein